MKIRVLLTLILLTFIKACGDDDRSRVRAYSVGSSISCASYDLTYTDKDNEKLNFTLDNKTNEPFNLNLEISIFTDDENIIITPNELLINGDNTSLLNTGINSIDIYLDIDIIENTNKYNKIRMMGSYTFII